MWVAVVSRDSKAKVIVWTLGFYFIMVGVWIIDVSVGALLTGHSLTTGWWIVEPMQQYHKGLMLVMIGGLMLFISNHLDYTLGSKIKSPSVA